MSLHEYLESREIDRHQYPFYSLIMAAMRQADTENGEKLAMVFPRVQEELVARYNAPGGMLGNEARYGYDTGGGE